MVIIFGVWMSPFCLLWLLPLVFTGMAMLLQSLGFHHGKTGICADSRGRWKTNKPLGTYGNWDTALKGMSILVKKIDKSKAMLTPGFVSSIGQTQEKEEVPPFRPTLNLAMVLVLFRRMHKVYRHSWEITTVFVTFSVALHLGFHSAALSQTRSMGIGPKTRQC